MPRGHRRHMSIQPLSSRRTRHGCGVITTLSQSPEGTQRRYVGLPYTALKNISQADSYTFPPQFAFEHLPATLSPGRGAANFTRKR